MTYQPGARAKIGWVIWGCFAACAVSGCATGPVANANRPPGLDYYIQGVRHTRSGNDELAVSAYEKAVAANPNLRMAHALLGDAYRERGDYASAATQYEAVTRLDKYAYVNHYNLGLTYQLLNRLQDAAAAYINALWLNPKDVKANMNLGLVELALGDMDKAIMHLRRATELDPNNAQAWSNLGVALDATGKAAEAESIYRRALELDSDNVITLQNLAQNLASQNKGPEALAIMEQVVQRDKSPAVRTRYANALAAARRYDEAMAEYDAILKENPRFLMAMNERGFSKIRQYTDGLELEDRHRQAAIDSWRASLKINPNQPRINEAVARWQNPRLFND